MARRCWWTAVTLLLLLTLVPLAAAAPVDFELPTVDGRRLRLADFRGRVVILDFFATWCGPCRGAMLKLDDLYQRYEKKGLSVIGYALDEEGLKTVRPFVARLGIGFPVVLGSMAQAERITPVQYLPTTLVIDPRGRIVARFVGGTGTRRYLAVIRPYLSDNPTPSPPSARVKRRRKGESRFQRVWVRYHQVLRGRRGLFVHVAVDLADLAPEQGLWLGLALRPEARMGSGLAPVGKAKMLYLRVSDASRLHHILFVRCDQLPQIPERGFLRGWVTIFGPGLKPLERSGEFIVRNPGCHTARAR